MDAKSRKLFPPVMSLRPSQAHVLAAVEAALRSAGTPQALSFDRGLEFTADAITALAEDLVFVAMPTRSYHPWHKGKVERLAGTVGRRAVRFVPQRSKDVALDLRKRPIVYADDESGNRIEAIDLDDLTPLVYAAVDDYNQRVHSSLGRSPDGAYDEDSDEAERLVDPALLRRLTLKEGSRTIREHGIRFKKRWYYHELLDGHRGEKHEIRYRPDDERRIDVYRDGRLLCSADLYDPATPQSRERVLTYRRKRAAAMQRTARRARKVARRQHKAITAADQTLTETTVVTQDEADQIAGTSARAAAALQRLGVKSDLDDRPN